MPVHPYRKLIIAGSEFAKTNALRNLINCKSDIGKIFYVLKIHTK